MEPDWEALMEEVEAFELENEEEAAALAAETAAPTSVSRAAPALCLLPAQAARPPLNPMDTDSYQNAALFFM